MWSVSQDVLDRMITLRHDGKTFEQIAAEMKFTRSKVAGVFHRHDEKSGGIDRPKKPIAAEDVFDRMLSLRRAGLTAAQIAERVGLNLGAVYCRFSRHDRQNGGADKPKARVSAAGVATARPTVEPRVTFPVQPEPIVIQAAPVTAPEAESVPVRFMDALFNKHCRFPLDAHASVNMLVCGRPVELGRSWCESCARKVFVPRVTTRRGQSAQQ